MIWVQTVEKERVYHLACLIPSSKLVGHNAFSLVSPSLWPTCLLVYLTLQSNSCKPLLHDCIEHVWEFHVRPVCAIHCLHVSVCRPAGHHVVSLSLYLCTFVVSCGKYTPRLDDIVQSATGSLDAHLLIQISQMRCIHLAQTLRGSTERTGWETVKFPWSYADFHVPYLFCHISPCQHR